MKQPPFSTSYDPRDGKSTLDEIETPLENGRLRESLLTQQDMTENQGFQVIENHS